MKSNTEKKSIYILPFIQKPQAPRMKMDFSITLLVLFSVMPSTLCQVIVHYTSSGGICGDTCGYHGQDYTWCRQKGGNGKSWDYCSLEEGLEASGKVCASSCDLWGGSYRYCYLRNGGWNYCGSLGLQNFVSYSQDNNMCLSPCRETNGYFQCNTIQGTQRCSPFRDVTPSGLPCHHNYRCATYGHSEYRCLLEEDESKWDHCGLNVLSKCTWVLNESNSSEIESCDLPYSQKEGKILFRRESSDRMQPPTKEEFKNAIHLIDKVYSVTSFPDPEPRATVHFYKQEDIFCKGINYTSVELEVGDPKASVQPIAHVVYPQTLKSAEILRLAFYTSLHSVYYSPPYTIAVSMEEPMSCSTDHQ